MWPVSGSCSALRKMIDVEFASAFDAVEWRCQPTVEQEAARLSPLAADTLYYATREMVRNAAKSRGQPDPRRNCACCSLLPSRMGNLD